MLFFRLKKTRYSTYRLDSIQPDLPITTGKAEHFSIIGKIDCINFPAQLTDRHKRLPTTISIKNLDFIRVTASCQDKRPTIMLAELRGVEKARVHGSFESAVPVDIFKEFASPNIP